MKCGFFKMVNKRKGEIALIYYSDIIEELIRNCHIKAAHIYIGVFSPKVVLKINLICYEYTLVNPQE